MTTICLATEYFPPHAPGGAEWSTDALARALARRGCRVLVITPNYGAASREERDGFTVIRFPFPVKRAPGRATIPGRSANTRRISFRGAPPRTIGRANSALR